MCFVVDHTQILQIQEKIKTGKDDKDTFQLIT